MWTSGLENLQNPRNLVKILIKCQRKVVKGRFFELLAFNSNFLLEIFEKSLGNVKIWGKSLFVSITEAFSVSQEWLMRPLEIKFLWLLTKITHKRRLTNISMEFFCISPPTHYCKHPAVYKTVMKSFQIFIWIFYAKEPNKKHKAL